MPTYCPLDSCTKPAIIHPVLGILPCSFHQKKRQHNNLPDHQIEFTSESIKEGRKEYFKSTIQPWRQHVASREFIEEYPEEAKKTFTEKEIRKAKYVWSDLPGAKNRKNSK